MSVLIYLVYLKDRHLFLSRQNLFWNSSFRGRRVEMAKPTRLTQDMIDEYKKRGAWDDVPVADILEGNAE